MDSQSGVYRPPGVQLALLGVHNSQKMIWGSTTLNWSPRDLNEGLSRYQVIINIPGIYGSMRSFQPPPSPLDVKTHLTLIGLKYNRQIQ